MHQTTTTLLALALALALPLATAGCYSNGGIITALLSDGADFKFGDLHSSPITYASSSTQNVDQEIADAIDAVCTELDGQAVGPGQSWSRCEDWRYTPKDYQCAQITCPSDCGGESECTASCVDECPLDEDEEGNSLTWEIKFAGDGEDAETLTYDVCSAAFGATFKDCEYGGDGERDGFWFRMDPNPHKCY